MPPRTSQLSSDTHINSAALGAGGGKYVKRMAEQGGSGALSSRRASSLGDGGAELKPAYKMLMAAQDLSSDSSTTRRHNKKMRKEARRIARMNKDFLKEEDPFLYYFGKVDKDKVVEYRSKERLKNE